MNLSSMGELLAYLTAIVPIVLAVYGSAKGVKDELNGTINQFKSELENDIKNLRFDCTINAKDTASKDELIDERLDKVENRQNLLLKRIYEIEGYLGKENCWEFPFKIRH